MKIQEERKGALRDLLTEAKSKAKTSTNIKDQPRRRDDNKKPDRSPRRGDSRERDDKRRKRSLTTLPLRPVTIDLELANDPDASPGRKASHS
eukprot:6740258-Heterocapsa_arctica.AAC.1